FANDKDDGTRGSIDEWDIEVAAAALDLELDQATAIFDAMRNRLHDGARLINWEKRQPDSGAERTRRWRQKKQGDTPDHPPGKTDHKSGQHHGVAANGDARDASVTHGDAKRRLEKTRIETTTES